MVMAASADAWAAEPELTARGNEPFWTLAVTAETIAFDVLGQNIAFKAPIAARETVDGRPRITAQAGAEKLELTVTERLCADTMTGMPFPMGVEVAYGGRVFQGCGGDMMTAIAGGWRVISLAGDRLPDAMTATIVFGRDGKVSGQSVCNRFFGGYTLSGEGLSFGQTGGTRMACPQAEMEAEQRFLDLLQKVSRVTPDGKADLMLMAGDQPAMLLRRTDGAEPASPQ